MAVGRAQPDGSDHVDAARRPLARDCAVEFAAVLGSLRRRRRRRRAPFDGAITPAWRDAVPHSTGRAPATFYLGIAQRGRRGARRRALLMSDSEPSRRGDRRHAEGGRRRRRSGARAKALVARACAGSVERPATAPARAGRAASAASTAPSTRPRRARRLLVRGGAGAGDAPAPRPRPPAPAAAAARRARPRRRDARTTST